MAPKKDAWRARIEHEIAKFMEGWDWERVFLVWRHRVGDFGVDVEQLFFDISVHDPKYPTDRVPCATWCPSDELAEYRKELQRHFDSFPGTYGPVEKYIGNKGEYVTLTYLSKARHNLSSLAGILIAASLFSRMGSTRRRYPDTWPSFHCVKPLLDMALARFGEKRFAWHYSSTQVLPVSNYDWEFTITDIRGLVRYLAQEHVLTLSKYKIVVINFDKQPDPFVAKQLQLEYRREAQEDAKRKRKYREERVAEQARQAKLKQEHPRLGKWKYVTKSELEQLVWSMPTVKVAKLYNVSDSAVGKKCKSMGIKKPPRGFWAQVQAGKRDHPKGKPQRVKR